MERWLDNKVALVTGGSRGIGRAIVVEFARRGGQVVYTYAKNVQGAEELRAQLAEEHLEAEAVACDGTQADSVRKVVRQVHDMHKRIDVLVNNAGTTRDGFLATMADDDWDHVIRTNLYGTFHFARSVLKLMMGQKSGAIVNLSSVAAIEGAPGQTNYAASKGAIVSFTKAMAMEAIGKGIRVNAVLPGFIQTDMTSRMSRDILKKRAESIPAGRLGTASEIAHIVAFLASDLASYIVGQCIVADGGLTHGGHG